MNRFFINISALCLLVLSITSCSSDGTTIAIPLTSPVLTIDEVTTSSISFTWSAVNGARQYGYRIADPNGEDVNAGVTTGHSASVTGLSPFTTYTITVTAFPAVTGTGSVSTTTTQDVSTLFYAALQDCETAYVSHLQANLATVTNRGTISEDRTAADYTGSWYGVFTISKFCGVNGHDMVFTVNRDNTITVLNGQGYDDEGRVILTTGKSSSATLSFDKIYIDESSAVFNGPGCTLTFSAQNNGTGNKLRTSTTETITWTIAE